MKVAFFITLCLLVCFTSKTKSQEDPWYKFYKVDNPCEPCSQLNLTNYPNLNWNNIPLQSYNIYIGKCIYQVKYKKRKCHFWDIKIESIEPLSPPVCKMNATNEKGELLSICDRIKYYADIYNTLLKAFLFANPMNFDTGSPSGLVDVWRVLRPKCIKVTEDEFSTQACKTGCCMNFLVFSRDTCNNVTVRDWTQKENGEECYPPGNDDKDGPCDKSVIDPGVFCIPVCNKLL